MASHPEKPFAFGCSIAVFPADEIEVLTDAGSHLEALASGTLQPASAADKHFLRVHRGEAEPRTLAERAWVRLIARREFEADAEAKPPPEPPKDYGMVEFDADRCWW